MDLPHQATSEDRARKSAAGRTDTSCPIYGTPNGASGGHPAVFKVSIISSSKYVCGVKSIFREIFRSQMLLALLQGINKITRIGSFWPSMECCNLVIM